MQPRELLCTQCNHHQEKKRFGEHIKCPACGSQSVVDFHLWRKYGAKKNTGDTQAG